MSRTARQPRIKVNLGRIVRVIGATPIESVEADDVAHSSLRWSRMALRGSRFGRRSRRSRWFSTSRASSRIQHATAGLFVCLATMVLRLILRQQTRCLPVYGLLPPMYRLPLVAFDATGMRVGEFEALTWGDVDEPAGRWRVRASTAKTRRARWVPVDDEVFAAVAATVPREDRDLGKQVFEGFSADRLRTAINRACKAAAIPAFSPHDLRHRRATLWHLSGVPVVDAAAGSDILRRSTSDHTHATLTDRSELDYPTLLGRVADPGRAMMRGFTIRSVFRGDRGLLWLALCQASVDSNLRPESTSWGSLVRAQYRP